MEMQIEIDDEIARKIVVQELTWHFHAVRESMVRLRSEDNLLPYQEEDLLNDTIMANHLQEVLKYFGTKEDFINAFGGVV